MTDGERELMAEIEAEARAAVAEGIESEAELVSYLDAAHIAPDAGRPWVSDSSGAAFNGSPYEVAVYTARESDPAQVAALLGYIWRGPMRGEWSDDGWLVIIPGHCYVFDLDTTKSQRDDVSDAWDAHKGWLVEGTPARKTDRAGAGTKGTRAHEGLGPVLLAWR